jgi:hypothetical protein
MNVSSSGAVVGAAALLALALGPGTGAAASPVDDGRARTLSTAGEPSDEPTDRPCFIRQIRWSVTQDGPQPRCPLFPSSTNR